LPRLSLTYGRFIEIIEAHGFGLHRHGATSHRRYRGMIAGQVRFVDVSGHGKEEIKPGTLASMIRQSGLPKAFFRR
jgi:predicted RNA binding protein YcfA (HicA-like mRNA interferase family)